MTREAVLRDFSALQFALGCPLVLDRLVGVDAERKPVAGLGLSLGARPVGRYRCPVPDRTVPPHGAVLQRQVSHAGAWIPVLFTRLAAKMAAEGTERLRVPIAAYLDSLAYHLDAGYLLAQVGLEAFSKRFVAEGDTLLLVKNGKDWSKFVRSLREQVEHHAAKAEYAKRITGKLHEAKSVPTGNLVPRALQACGLAVPKNVLDEVGFRSRSVHEFLMSCDDPRELQADVGRRTIIQTLIAALVAKYVSYDGPICGWDRDDEGHEVAPDWWDFDEGSDQCWQRFISRRSDVPQASGKTRS